MRRVAVLVPAAVGALCGVYAVVYLVRWEWNRAIIAGIFFLAVEVIVLGVLILDRLHRLETRLEEDRPAAGAEVPAPGDRPVPDTPDPTLAALRAAAPPPADRFSWIRDRSGSMQVFLPVLLGAGVLASAAAWLVEHLARATVGPTLERRLAERLDILELPAGGLRRSAATEPLRPRRSRVRPLLAGVVCLALLVVGAMGLDRLGDLTQTRPDQMRPGVQTIVDVTLRGAVADGDPDRVVGHLWSVCTGPDVFRSRRLPAPTVAHGADGAVRIVVDTDIGDHGIDRLRGCLNDATIDKVQATVGGVTVG